VNDAEADASGPSTPRTEPTLIERAYVLLRDDIVEGRLAPGERLRVEHLTARYGASAGTLREALTRLASDALIEVAGRRGFRVTPVALKDLEELTSLRLHIEIDALRKSVRAGDAAWRAQLTQAYEALAAHEQPLNPGNRKSWEALNARFHEALISAGASSWTFKVLRQLWQHGERYRRLSIRLLGDGRDVHAEHQYIFESAMAAEELRAALALEAHISATTDQLVRAHRDGRLGSIFR
jgi:DNA-binding GntR family transcriptional regulator